MAKVYIGGNKSTENKVMKWNRLTPSQRLTYISSPSVRSVKTQEAKWKRIMKQL